MTDASSLINVALATNAATIASAEASQQFRGEVESLFTTDIALNEKEKLQAERMLGMKFRTRPKKYLKNDHPVLAVIRQFVRKLYTKAASPLTTKQRTLVVGAAAREFYEYNSNPNVAYHFHLGEGKDMSRTVTELLEFVATSLSKRLSKKEKSVFIDPNDPNREIRPALKRYLNIKAMLTDVEKLAAGCNMFHEQITDEHKYNTLLFEDSIYNFSKTDLVDIFRKTGANEAYGYALLPWELYYSNMPQNGLYRVTEFKGPDGVKRAALTFRGFCAGYVHNYSNLMTLFEHQVICSNIMNLHIEITDRVGPYVIFRIGRSNVAQTVVREVSLPENLHYVRVLDFFSSVNIKTGNIRFPLKYISVFRHEYNLVMQYLLKLKPESVTIQNTLMYISRLREGVNLVNNELVSPWYLRESDVYPVAFAIFMQAQLVMDKTQTIKDNVGVTSVWAKLKRFFFRVYDFMTLPLCLVKDLVNWVMQEHLTGKIVLYPHCEELYYTYCPEPSKPMQPNLTVDPKEFHDPKTPTCPICSSMHGKLGKQKILCGFKHNSQFTFKMTKEQLDSISNNLIDNDEDAVGLKTVKERANKCMPATEFTWTVNVNYIRGGPGTGKSYIIRKLLRPGDLVIAPFTKLRKDYVKQIDLEDGSFSAKNFSKLNVGVKTEKFEPVFKTTHRAINNFGADRIFLDEFSSFDMDFLAMVCYLNGATQLFIVGDHKQTKIRAGEGTYIGDEMKLEDLSYHELRVNFRNPPDIVALLNRKYGYNMESAQAWDEEFWKRQAKDRGSIRFTTNKEITANNKVPIFSFSKMTGEKNSFEKKNTVRQNQGQSLPEIALVVGEDDRNLTTIEELVIVAISRHEKLLYIGADDQEPAYNALIANWEYDIKFLAELKEYLPTHEVIEDNSEADMIDTIAQTLISPINDTTYTPSEIIEMTQNYKMKLPISTRIKYDQSGLFNGVNVDNMYHTKSLLAALLKTVALPVDAINMCAREFSRGAERFNLMADALIDYLDSDVVMNLLTSSKTRITKVFSDLAALLSNVKHLKTRLTKDDTIPDEGFFSKYRSDILQWLKSATKTKFSKLLKGIKKIPTTLNTIVSCISIACSSVEEEEDDTYEFHETTPELEMYEFFHELNRENNEVLKNMPTAVIETYNRVFADYNQGEEFSEAIATADAYVKLQIHKHDVEETVQDLARKIKIENDGDCMRELVNTLTNTFYYISPTVYARATTMFHMDNHVDLKPFEGSKPMSLSVFVRLTELGWQFFKTTKQTRLSANPKLDKSKGKTYAYGYAHSEDTTPFDHQREYFIADVYYDQIAACAQVEPEYRPDPIEQSPSDVFMMYKEESPNVTDLEINPTLNIRESFNVEPGFSNGTLNPEMFAPINERGHPIDESTRGYKATAGYGLSYSSKSTWQTMQVVRGRYLKKIPKQTFDDQAKLLAHNMVKEFFFENMKAKIEFPDDHELHDILDKYARDCVTRNYYKSAVGYENDTQIKTVRFFLKNIFKPAKTKLCLDKVGQGISAWSKDAQILFGASARILNFMIRKNSKSNFIYDNMVDEDTLLNEINTEMGKLPSIAKNGLLDQAEFDSSQNRFTQEIEKEWARRFMLSALFVTMYFWLRVMYRLMSSYIVGKVESVKTSGEPLTLPGNTMVSTTQGNYLLRGKGPSATLGKGDDYSKRQMEIAVDHDRLETLGKYVNAQLKLDIGDDVEFCGNVYSNGSLIPCLQRKVKKILGHTFRDYKHFTEYQISLRDFYSRIRKIGLNKVLAINAGLAKSYENSMQHLYIINSFSHIDEAQFCDVFKLVKYDIDNRFALY